MKAFLKSMQKKKSGIPGEVLPIFEGIIQKYEAIGTPGLGHACEAEFTAAMEQHLTREQRFWLYEQNGACKGTGRDKERKAFAADHAHLCLGERLALFSKNAVLQEDNTITLPFVCTHGYYKKVREGRITALPSEIESYFAHCAGGRLYELQKALGIKLRIKDVDIEPLKDDLASPVVFTFAVVG